MEQEWKTGAIPTLKKELATLILEHRGFADDDGAKFLRQITK
jgi:hypothetical protein